MRKDWDENRKKRTGQAWLQKEKGDNEENKKKRIGRNGHGKMRHK